MVPISLLTMGLDLLVDRLFRTGADGQQVFAPFSYWGRGVIVPDQATRDRLQRQCRWIFGVSIALAMAVHVAEQQFGYSKLLDANFAITLYTSVMLRFGALSAGLQPAGRSTWFNRGVRCVFGWLGFAVWQTSEFQDRQRALQCSPAERDTHNPCPPPRPPL